MVFLCFRAQSSDIPHSLLMDEKTTIEEFIRTTSLINSDNQLKALLVLHFQVSQVLLCVGLCLNYFDVQFKLSSCFFQMFY